MRRESMLLKFAAPQTFGTDVQHAVIDNDRFKHGEQARDSSSTTTFEWHLSGSLIL
jgi:hypothetical protein